MPVIAQNRLYYNYDSSALYETPSLSGKQMRRPIYVKEGTDLQIVILHFNPLKTELFINDTSYNRFLEGGQTFSSLLVTPSAAHIPTEKSNLNASPSIWGYDVSDSNIQSETLLKTVIIKRYPVHKLTACDTLNDLSLELNDVNDKLTAAITNYKEFAVKVEFINKKLSTLKSRKALLPSIVVTELNNYLIELNTSLINILSTDITKTSGQDILNREEELNKSIAILGESLVELKQQADKIRGRKCTDFTNRYQVFNSSYADLKKSVDDFTKIRIEKGLAAIASNTSLYDQLMNYAFEAPMQITYARTIEKDKHTIYLYEKEAGKDKKIYDVINIEPKQGLKISFATGIFFSGLNDMTYSKTTVDSFIQKKYTVGGTPGGQVRDTLVAQTFTHLYNKDQTKMSFGAMIYMQFHTRNEGNFNVGMYIGLGALFNDQTRFTIGTGVSLLIGKVQRFAINAGAVMAQVDRLDPPYNTETWYAKTIDNIPTFRAWKVQPSLGFSWNF